MIPGLASRKKAGLAPSAPLLFASGDKFKRVEAASLILVLGLAGCAAYEPERAVPAPPSSLMWQRDAGALTTTARVVSEKKFTPPQGEIDLLTAIELALQANPRTRAMWSATRVAEAELDEKRGAWLPKLDATAEGGYSVFLFPTTPRPSTVRESSATPQLRLTWLLVDFGRRRAVIESAAARLMASNLGFDRRLQEVVFETQAAYFALDAAFAMVEAAGVSLERAIGVREAVESRLAHGLATRPDAALARQVEAKSRYDLETARVLVSDAQASLALALGVRANQPPAIIRLRREGLAKHFDGQVDALVDQALGHRPDLAAKAAELRAREAELRRSRADFLPEIGFSGAYGQDSWWYTNNGPPTVEVNRPVYDVQVGVRWRLFDGLERLASLRQAEAEIERVRADLEATELDVTAEVWRVWHQLRAARRKVEYAEALRVASSDAFESGREMYARGLFTIVELLDAERDLAEALFILIQSQADLLTKTAELTWVVGFGTPGSAALATGRVAAMASAASVLPTTQTVMIGEYPPSWSKLAAAAMAPSTPPGT